MPVLVGSGSNAISPCSRASKACRKFEIVGASHRAHVGPRAAAIAASALRQRRLAQKQAGRKPFDGVAHDALRVLGLDHAVDGDGNFVKRAVGGEGMGDVAERVLVLVEPAIGGHVDAPVDHLLAVVIARRQPQ